MATTNVSAKAVLHSALEMIVRIDHINAEIWDEFIDEKMQEKTFWLRRPRFKTRNDIIELYDDVYWGEWHVGQRLRCEQLANLARTALEQNQADITITDLDISSLGVCDDRALNRSFEFLQGLHAQK